MDEEKLPEKNDSKEENKQEKIEKGLDEIRHEQARSNLI